MTAITKTICDTVVSRKKTLGDKMDEEVNKNWRGCQGVINQYLPPDFDYQPLAKPYKFEDKGGGWSVVGGRLGRGPAGRPLLP